MIPFILSLLLATPITRQPTQMPTPAIARHEANMPAADTTPPLASVARIPHVLNPLAPPPPLEPDRDTGVEVRLELLHQTGGTAATDLSLAVSIINHLDRDIYIPCFRLFGSYAGIHYYQKDSGEWREWDLFAQQPTRDWHCLIYDNGVISYVTPLPHFYNNDIIRYLEAHSAHIRTMQDSILVAFCGGNAQLVRQWRRGEEPVFLKAKEELKYLAAYDLRFLLAKNEEYRIGFNTSPRDTTLHKYWEPKGPDHIFNYERYTPATIKPSLIYFSTIDPAAPPSVAAKSK